MKFTTKTTHHVDYNDLDEAISEFLKEKGATKTNFEIVAYEELGNYTAKTFNISKYDWAFPSEEEKQEILDGKLHWRTGKIMEWMHAEEKIPAGDYIVKINW
jgi:hypothetical protein